MTNPAPVLKYPGSKWRLAKWIIGHFPAHATYLEPFFGSGAVLFTKPPSKVETVNDLNNQVANLFRVLRERPEELAALVDMTPWSREEYNLSYELIGDPLEDARRFLVRCWQGRYTKLVHRTGWRYEINADAGKVTSWDKLPNRILEAATRLKQVQIENRPALEVIEIHKYHGVLIYADPPYSLSTRAQKIYANEMTDTDHLELLDALDMHPGPVVLSGYMCDLYDERLRHWTRRTRGARAETGDARTEILWINPVAAKSLQVRLFDEVIQ